MLCSKVPKICPHAEYFNLTRMLRLSQQGVKLYSKLWTHFQIFSPQGKFVQPWAMAVLPPTEGQDTDNWLSMVLLCTCEIIGRVVRCSNLFAYLIEQRTSPSAGVKKGGEQFALELSVLVNIYLWPRNHAGIIFTIRQYQ